MYNERAAFTTDMIYTNKYLHCNSMSRLTGVSNEIFHVVFSFILTEY